MGESLNVLSIGLSYKISYLTASPQQIIATLSNGSHDDVDSEAQGISSDLALKFYLSSAAEWSRRWVHSGDTIANLVYRRQLYGQSVPGLIPGQNISEKWKCNYPSAVIATLIIIKYIYQPLHDISRAQKQLLHMCACSNWAEHFCCCSQCEHL